MTDLSDPVHIAPIRRSLTGWRRYLPPGFRSPAYQVVREITFNPAGFAPVTVKPGFVSNGASVPFPLTMFWPRGHSDYLASALIHDWLYAGEHPPRPRQECDAIFRQALKAQNMGPARAWMFWAASRLFGGVVRTPNKEGRTWRSKP